MSVTAAPVEEADTEQLTARSTDLSDAWATIVWDDPVNLMSYVTYVFQTYFGYPRERAERLMRQVHEEGRARVSTGTRERMEVDAQAMHGYGLWATVERGDG